MKVNDMVKQILRQEGLREGAHLRPLSRGYFYLICQGSPGARIHFTTYQWLRLLLCYFRVEPESVPRPGMVARLQQLHETLGPVPRRSRQPGEVYREPSKPRVLEMLEILEQARRGAYGPVRKDGTVARWAGGAGPFGYTSLGQVKAAALDELRPRVKDLEDFERRRIEALGWKVVGRKAVDRDWLLKSPQLKGLLAKKPAAKSEGRPSGAKAVRHTPPRPRRLVVLQPRQSPEEAFSPRFVELADLLLRAWGLKR